MEEGTLKAEVIAVAVAEVPVGAVVARDVTDGGGQLLVPAGTEITEKMRDLLMRREIDSLEIKQAANLSEAELEQLTAELRERLDLQFSTADDSAFMQQFKEMLLRHHLREYQ